MWNYTKPAHFRYRLLSYRLVPVENRRIISVTSSGFPPLPRSVAGRRQSTVYGTWLLKTASL